MIIEYRPPRDSKINKWLLDIFGDYYRSDLIDEICDAAHVNFPGACAVAVEENINVMQVQSLRFDFMDEESLFLFIMEHA